MELTRIKISIELQAAREPELVRLVLSMPQAGRSRLLRDILSNYAKSSLFLANAVNSQCQQPPVLPANGLGTGDMPAFARVPADAPPIVNRAPAANPGYATLREIDEQF